MLQKGDTIIEVMLAFTVFAMVAVGSLTIMNRGVASAQQSLELTLVRQHMDGQAELLRHLHDAYSADPSASSDTGSEAARYADIISRSQSVTAPSSFGDQSCANTIPGSTSFVIDPYTIQVKGASHITPMNRDDAPSFAKIASTSGAGGGFAGAYGIWIEPVKGADDGSNQGFIDFHIRSCWYGTVGSYLQTLGTIVRLYTPRMS